MQDNTYDVPSYKFGFILPNHPIEFEDDANYRREFDEVFRIGSFFIVPFESFDGLTVEEMLKAIRSHGIQFTCYSEYFNPVIHSNVITLYYTLLLQPSFLRKIRYERIDEVVESELLNEYTKNNFQHRKVVECYLERYMCGSYKETDNKIFKLNPLEQNT